MRAHLLDAHSSKLTLACSLRLPVNLDIGGDAGDGLRGLGRVELLLLDKVGHFADVAAVTLAARRLLLLLSIVHRLTRCLSCL